MLRRLALYFLYGTLKIRICIFISLLRQYQIYSLHILQQTDIYPENYVNLARIHDVCCIYTKTAEDRNIVMADVMRICEKQISKDIF